MSLVSSEKTAYYSQFSFLSDPASCAQDFINILNEDMNNDRVECFDADNDIQIYFRKLIWDTDFFGIPVFKIVYTALPSYINFFTVQSAFMKFREYVAALYPEFYLFTEVPAEDTAVIAGMGSDGWRLIETRVTFFRDDLQKFEYPRSAVRNATEADIPELRNAAMQAINHYDRFHADDFFTLKESNDFLATFIENSVKGFADEVIVPAHGLANAFLTGKYIVLPPSLASRKAGQMVLSAVTPVRTGWYVRLIAELSLRFKEQGLDTAFMTTQITNRTVLKVWSRHGYRIGRYTHIFSTYSRAR